MARNLYRPLICLCLGGLAMAAGSAKDNGWLLVTIGAALGITLQRTRFGFSAAYRELLVHRRSEGVLAQLLMLATASALFTPLLAKGSFGATPLYGALAPAGPQVAIGAFLFGIGMQLAGGCGSGTLLASGNANRRAWLALLAFCVGAFQGGLDLGFWQQLPTLPAVSVGEQLGWSAGLATQLLLISGIAALLARLCPPQFHNTAQAFSLRRGPGLWISGALLLALLNLATLVTAGHPWSITWAFSLWAAKAASLVGWNPLSSEFWSAPFQSAALAAPLWRDTTSVMNIALLLGVALVSQPASPQLRVTTRQWLAALIGGLLLGYGARLAYGCNVGAFFSGIASGSLHGWLWILCALPGNWLGIKLRPRFQLNND